MKHIITLSGNSERFTSLGYPHKSLLSINGKTALKIFIDCFSDFKDFDTIFLCRKEDLQSTNLEKEIKKHSNGKILSIDSNTLGPVYSVNQIQDHISDDEELVITYIDSLQKTSLQKMRTEFSRFDGGLNVHGFKHPHWRFNKNFCLVKHDKSLVCTDVLEKYDFNKIDFDNASGCCGSSGSYYFKSGQVYKHYSNILLNSDQRINNEYYITQIYNIMIDDGLKVKAFYAPYGNLGTPEDVEDYIFWDNWFCHQNG